VIRVGGSNAAKREDAVPTYRCRSEVETRAGANRRQTNAGGAQIGRRRLSALEHDGAGDGDVPDIFFGHDTT
jgi:hypothetical protein